MLSSTVSARARWSAPRATTGTVGRALIGRALASAGAVRPHLTWGTRRAEDDHEDDHEGRRHEVLPPRGSTTREQRELLHELRSTMAGLVSGSVMLDNPDVPPEARQRLWESMRRELDRMDRLLSGSMGPTAEIDLDEALEPILELQRLKGRHVEVRGHRISIAFRGKHKIQVRTTLVDEELAAAMKELLARKGARVFRYENDGSLHNLTSRRLNDYVKLHLGDEFTAKDFRTWGGTLTAAVAFAERVRRYGFPETKTDEKRSVSAVMRRVSEQLGNTPAVCRASYVSPAVVDQYLDGRTIEDFRPRHLRVVGARQVDLDPEELALLSLLRSWRIRRAREAA